MENDESIWAILHSALYVCATDGMISDIEEENVLELFSKSFPTIDAHQIATQVDNFFSSNEQLESYANKITSLEHRELALHISVIAASSDGLDYRENLALSRLINLWKINVEAIHYGP